MSSDAAALPTALDALAQRLRRLADFATSVRPRYFLGALLMVQWLAVLALALTVKHNGWLYYAGGDQLWHYSGAYLMAHGHLPPTFVGYGWSFLLLPVAAIAGPNLVSALPAIVLFNTLVLLPVALLCVYGIGARIAGRLFGYFSATLWIALPYLGIVFVEPGYHQKYTELTLPQLLGLSSVPDFPATVALLVSAYFCLRALESGGWQAAAAGGLAAGYSIAVKPSNSIFLVAPAVLLLVEKRRALLPFAAGLAPALLTLTIWKYRGLGELAAAPAEPVRLAGSVGDLLDRIHNRELNTFEHFRQVLLALREHFWAARVMEWLPVAGAIGLLARSRRGFLLVGTWFAVFIVAKATYVPASVEDASFWRILMPAFPAYLLLGAAVVLLVPGVRARPAPGSFVLAGRRLAVALATAVAVFVVLPLGVIGASPPLEDSGREAVIFDDNLLPVSSAIGLQATVGRTSVRLSWEAARPGSAFAFYRLLRTKGETDVFCAGTPAADQCRLYAELPASTRSTTYVDRPEPGTWTYRIGVSANWLDDERLGDVYLLSPPKTVTVP
ncbi:hypothetical protein BH18ACT12_BH18ACT12_21870 [soil metagenome]